MNAMTRTIRLMPCVGLLLASTALPALAEMSSAVRTTSQQVKGLQAPPRSSSTIGASRTSTRPIEHDAFFMQGYNAARDRLWQIDLWRKRGLGLLAKDFGPDYADQDRAARMFLYRGDMDKEWAAYGPKAKTYTEAFVEGVERIRPGGPRRHASRSGRVQDRGNAARSLEAGGRRADPQPWPDPQRRVRGPSGPGRLRRRPRCGSPAHQVRAGLEDLRAGGPRPVLDPQGRPQGLRTRREGRLVRAAAEEGFAGPARGFPRQGHGRRRPDRLQQLGRRRLADRDRAADPGQRPAPRPRRAVPALHRASERARPVGDRSGRAGAAGHLHRTQRQDRLRPDDLRDRPGRPLRLRPEPGERERVQVPGRLGADDGGARDDRGQRRGAPQCRAVVHPSWSGAGARRRRRGGRSPCGRSGSTRAPRPISDHPTT